MFSCDTSAGMVATVHRNLPPPEECRALARAFRSKATEPGVPARTATIMSSISRSLSGLASQLELLVETAASERSMPARGAETQRQPLR